MNLFIYVEGQEEELFVNRVLRNHLRMFGIAVKKPILAATSFSRIDQAASDVEGLQKSASVSVTVGGVTNYASICADIRAHFDDQRIQSGDVLTTLIDLYALPRMFPGCQEAMRDGLRAAAKASKIEAAWKADIGRPNFFPYIQVHEFEALVLARPELLADYYPEHSAKIETLCAECAAFCSPEEINETKESSPSHRIKTHVPSYVKEDGFRFLEAIGIEQLKAICPRFKEWIEHCEQFFR